MKLDAPASAFTPFMDRRVRVYLSASRADPARAVEVCAQVLLRDPFATSGMTGASMAQPVTWGVTCLRSALPALPRPGNVVEVLDADGAAPARLTVAVASANGANGPLVHLSCEARGGARP